MVSMPTNNVQPIQAPAIDPGVKALASAIKRAETGTSPDAYTKKGASGEYGAYQFMPGTWKDWSKKHIGDENAPMTIENQNKVAYSQIKSWKDQGYNPAQIASLWNSGKPNWEGNVGTNKEGVHFDTPSYVKRVSSLYKEMKTKIAPPSFSTSGGQSLKQPTTVLPSEPPTSGGVKGFFSQLGSAAKTAGQDMWNISSGLVRDVTKPIAETAIQFPRAFASGVAGLFGNEQAAQKLAQPVNVPFFGQVKPLSAVPGEASAAGQLGQAAEIGANLVGAGGAAGIAEQTGKGLVKSAIKEGAVTGTKAGALGGLGAGLQSENPTLASVAGSTALGTAGGALGGALLGPLAARSTSAGRGAIMDQELTDFVSPILTKSQKEMAVASRRATPGGLLETPAIKASKHSAQVADAVKGVVNPSKGYIQGANDVFDAIGKEADALKTAIKANDKKYTVIQLKGALRKVEKPLVLKGDVESIYKDAETKFLEFANKQPRTASGLLQARKDFDQWIEQQVPKIFDDPKYSALHQALRDMRTQANEFIASKVPNADVQKSLLKQSLMYEAKDNLAEKAVKEELGSTGIQSKLTQFAKKHPVVTAGAQLLGAGAAYEKGKKILGL